MHTLTWAQLSDSERRELQMLVSENRSDAYYTNNDWLAFPLIGFLAGLGGTVALVISGDIGETVPLIPELIGDVPIHVLLQPFAFLAPLVLTVWITIFVLRNWKRRGHASTSFATVRVCGPKLKLMRHSDVARITRRVIKSKSSSFTVFELFDSQNAKLTFDTSGNFANAATAAIERVRNEKIPVSDR